MAIFLQVILALGTIMAGVMSAFATVYLLSKQKSQVEATTDKTKAEGEAITVGTQQMVIADLLNEVERLSKRVAALEASSQAQTLLLAEYQGREWVALDNIETLRRALTDAGVAVPTLRTPSRLTYHGTAFGGQPSGS